MIHELLPGLLAVEVPEGAYSVQVRGNLIGYFITSSRGNPFPDAEADELPSIGWSILGLGTADKITEQEWAGVDLGCVDLAGVDFVRFDLVGKLWYKDYSALELRYRFDNRTASGLSLLKLNGLNPSTTVLLTNKK